MIADNHTVVVELGDNGSVNARAHIASLGWTARVTKGMRPVDLTSFPVAINSAVHDLSLKTPFASSKWTKECQNEYKSERRPKCKLRFHVVGDLTYNDTILHLDWIREDGCLEAYHPPRAPSGYTSKGTCLGHAWALYRLPRSSKTSLAKMSDIDPESLILAFRPKHTGEHIVLVRLGSDGSAHAQAWQISTNLGPVPKHFRGLPIAKVVYSHAFTRVSLPHARIDVLFLCVFDTVMI